MYKALQNLRRPFICVFTFNHHSSKGGRCHPRRVLGTQVKAGGGRLWQELRDPGSLSWMYSASISGSQSCPEFWLWHCPGCCQINLNPALRVGSVETQSAVLQSLSTLRSTLNAWIRLCLVSAVKGFTSSKHSLETLRFHFISAADCSVTFAPSLYANLSHCRPPGNAATEQNTQVRRDRGDYKVHFPKTVLQVRTWSFKEGNCLSKDPSSSGGP